MNKDFRNQVLLSSVLFCGVPTGLINGLIAFFTGKQLDFASAGVDLAITMAAVAFITSLIVYPLGKKTAHKLPSLGEPGFYGKLPQSNLALAAIITVIISTVFVAIPFAIWSILPQPQVIEPVAYSIFKGLYSVPVAATTNFIATAVVKLASEEAPLPFF